MSNTVKMQHYVPRLYLRNYAIDTSESNPIVHCFKKQDRGQFKTSLDNIAGEKYFYDIPEDPDQDFETDLNKIEGDFNQSYETLLEHKDLDVLDDNDRALISYFVILQDLRTRENREHLLDMFSSLRKKLEGIPGAAEMEEMDALRDLETTEGATRFQREFIENRAWDLADVLYEMKWILYTNDPEETGMPFWTSDHPIFRYNHVDHNPYGSLGFRSKGIQIYFPLSPTLSIGFCDPEMFGGFPSKLSASEEHVKFQNVAQVRESTRHVIANADDFSLAVDYLEEFPQYADLDRDRVSVE